MADHPRSLLEQNIAAAVATLQSLTALAEPLRAAAELIARSLAGGGKVITCGNGGSAADASHFATELVCRFEQDRRPYPAISLVDFGSTLSAVGNDYGFDHIFARQVRAFGARGDVLVTFSTSGKSRNILLALETAREVGVHSVAFLGKGGGAARGIANVELHVPAANTGGTDTTARIQEAHLVLYHTLCQMIETHLSDGADHRPQPIS